MIHKHILEISIDKAGDPWFTAQGGVAMLREDGTWYRDIEHVSLRGHWLMSLAFDAEDRPWLGSRLGFRIGDGDHNWSGYSVREGIAGHEVRAIETADDGSVWVGSWGGGSSRRNPDGTWTAFRRYSSSQENAYANDHPMGDGLLQDIEYDAVNRLTWFGTSIGAVAMHPDGSWVRYTVADGLADNYITDILARKDGTVWLSTNRGVSRRNQAGNWESYGPDDGLGSVFVRNIAEDFSGNLWFSISGGVSMLTPDGAWTVFDQGDGIRGSDGRVVGVDSGGTVWLGTNLALNERLADGKWRSTPSNTEINAIVADSFREGIWYAGREGLRYRSEEGLEAHFRYVDGLASDNVRALALDASGRVWVGTGGAGVSVLDPEPQVELVDDLLIPGQVLEGWGLAKPPAEISVYLSQ